MASTEVTAALTMAALVSGLALAAGDTVHVWEKVEIVLAAQKTCTNPYTDVDVYVDLEGPDFRRRCYGFWDGGSTFRVRVLATRPGTWRWRSGSNTDDPGLNAATGSFEAVPWSQSDLKANPSRHGMIRPTVNGHALQHADGTPFFLLGDTWWATATFRYPWHGDDRERPLGPKAGLKDFVRYRKAQGFNCIAMIAAFPAWANDGKPARWNEKDGTVIRAAWRHPTGESAKDMHDEAGNRPFLFPGRIPGLEKYVPDLERINPAYFQSMDRKIDYLNAQGFVPFIEVTRRDIGQLWKKHYPWPDSYVRYIQYVWSRYQANICLFSPIHFDTPHASISASAWNATANRQLDRYGPPPFGTMAGTNSNPSTLRNFGHVDKAKWLTFHQVGNRRTHDLYPYLTEIYEAKPPVPGLNGEPYYDGMLDAEAGSDRAALYCRSGMYGSVLSGGLAGHIYGAGGWNGGMWGGNRTEGAPDPIWEAIQWPSAGQMQHLRAFVLSEGARYRDLVPSADLLDPSRAGKAKSCVGWAYCARTPDREFFLLYFETECPPATLSGAKRNGKYAARWFNPRTGRCKKPVAVTANGRGTIALPPFPDKDDWAMKLTLE